MSKNKDKEKHDEPKHSEGPEEREGTERLVYEEYLSRKWEGSAPPSPQAYARAIQLWRQLPGAIMTTPADLGTIPEPTPGEYSEEPSQKHDEAHERNLS